MNNLIVIEQVNKDEASDIIGVGKTMDICLNMIQEYYGSYTIVSIKDIRESGIEYVYNIICDEEALTIVFRDFELNSL
jgi:hypothetical protein